MPVVLATIAFVSVRTQRPTTQTKPNPYAAPNPPAAARPLGKGLPFLIVVPSQGVSAEDYYPLRRRLQDAGVRVVTASGRGGVATPPLFTPDAPTVTVDVRLDDIEAAAYSGVAFCGLDVEEYTDPDPGGATGAAAKARSILDAMRAASKPVGGISAGEGVLVAHGVLNGKPAARGPLLAKRFPQFAAAPGVTWLEQRVVVAERRVVTARAAADAAEFADALLEALRAE